MAEPDLNESGQNISQRKYCMNNKILLVACSGLFLSNLTIHAQTNLLYTGYDADGTLSTTPDGVVDHAVAVSASHWQHNAALLDDGTVKVWGNNDYGQCDVPLDLSGVVAINTGSAFSLALKNDGTVVAWGYCGQNQCNIPEGLSDVTAIACGDTHALALKSDGTVVAWGDNGGPATVPEGLSGVAAIAAGGFSMALLSNGTVVAWGPSIFVPDGLTDVVSISAGGYHALALKSDGTVVTWGVDALSSGVLSIPTEITNNVVAVAAGYYHSAVITTDNRVVAWGYNGCGETTTVTSSNAIIGLAAGLERNIIVTGAALP